LIFGLAPAHHSARGELVETLKDASRGTSDGGRRGGIRNLLVVTELAIAVVLLVVAGLLIQSLWRLRNVDSGLHAQNVLTTNVALPEIKYNTDRQTQFFID